MGVMEVERLQRARTYYKGYLDVTKQNKTHSERMKMSIPNTLGHLRLPFYYFVCPYLSFFHKQTCSFDSSLFMQLDTDIKAMYHCSR